VETEMKDPKSAAHQNPLAQRTNTQKQSVPITTYQKRSAPITSHNQRSAPTPKITRIEKLIV
jgi:hypothetical protein